MEQHALIVGRSGAGKSKLMETMFYDMQRKSQRKKQFSLVCIDPHGDTAKALLGFAHNSDRSRLVYVSSTISREAGIAETYTACINPFENDSSETMIYLLSTELSSAIAELLSDSSTPITVQMATLLRFTITTTLRSESPSLLTLARFFSDKNGVNNDLISLGQRSPNQLERDFFTQDFSSTDYMLTRRSIRTKILYFLSDPMLFGLLNGKSTINLEQALNEGKVIIFNLPKGASKFTSNIFSRLMIAYIHALVLRRDALAPKDRTPVFLFIDEFGTILTSSLAASLAEARKYKLSLILATQSLKQIQSTEIRKTVMVNTNLKAVGLTDYEDRVAFSKEMGVGADKLNKLEPLQFAVKKNEGGKNTAFRFNVPILSTRYFLSEQERKALLLWLVYESGIYQKVLPLPPAPPSPQKPVENTEKQAIKSKTSRKDDNPFKEGQKPAF